MTNPIQAELNSFMQILDFAALLFFPVGVKFIHGENWLWGENRKNERKAMRRKKAQQFSD